MKLRLTLLSSVLFSFLISAFFLAGCKKNDVATPAPSISGFSPLTDTVGAIITITGTNFSSNASANIVKLNGVVAEVVSSTPTQLTIKIPVGGTNGKITVTVNGQSATSAESLTLLGPSIGKFSPAISGIGYPVIIKGENFSADPGSNKVTINGIQAPVVLASDTQLVVTVPLEASSGKISVTVKGQGVTTSSDITIKKLTVTTIAGSVSGYSDGLGSAAAFSGPWGIVGDHNGNYYVADTYNSRIRKVTSSGVVTTLTGTNFQGNIDGSVTVATFGLPFGVAMDSQGNLFVTNLGWSTIRKITPAGIVSTFAGDPNGSQGTTNGTGTSARFHSPLGIAIDGNDNIYVADADNGLIRKITSAGVVTTFAGSGVQGSADGNGVAASFKNPWGIVTDPAGNLFVLDPGNNNIRKITPAGDVTTFAGNGTAGSADGPALTASFNGLIGMVRDQNGNFYVTDENANRIRMITPDGIVVTLAGNGNKASVDGVGNFASFNSPLGITIDTDGVMYLTDNGSNSVRKMVVQ